MRICIFRLLTLFLITSLDLCYTSTLPTHTYAYHKHFSMLLATLLYSQCTKVPFHFEWYTRVQFNGSSTAARFVFGLFVALFFVGLTRKEYKMQMKFVDLIIIIIISPIWFRLLAFFDVDSTIMKC